MSTRKPAPDREAALAQAIQAAFAERLPPMHCYKAAAVHAALEGDWSVDEVLIGLHREVDAGRLQTHFSHVEGTSVFWLVPPQLVIPAATATPTLAASIGTRVPQRGAAPEDATEAYRPAGLGDLAPRDATASSPSPVSDPLSLRGRLETIAVDLEDAIGDACDTQLPHDVLKALAVASGAMQRVVRRFAA